MSQVTPSLQVASLDAPEPVAVPLHEPVNGDVAPAGETLPLAGFAACDRAEPINDVTRTTAERHQERCRERAVWRKAGELMDVGLCVRRRPNPGSLIGTTLPVY